MGESKDREREFVRALMVLGPAPPKSRRIGNPLDPMPAHVVKEQVDAYLDRVEYGSRAERYWLRHVAGIEKWADEDVVVVAKKIKDTEGETWVGDYFKWQETYRKENT